MTSNWYLKTHFFGIKRKTIPLWIIYYSNHIRLFHYIIISRNFIDLIMWKQMSRNSPRLNSYRRKNPYFEDMDKYNPNLSWLWWAKPFKKYLNYHFFHNNWWKAHNFYKLNTKKNLNIIRGIFLPSLISSEAEIFLVFQSFQID